MPGESMETATNFGKTAENIAKTAGVDTGVLLNDMAKNAGLMATYSKGGAEGFGKAAAEACSCEAPRRRGAYFFPPAAHRGDNAVEGAHCKAAPKAHARRGKG